MEVVNGAYVGYDKMPFPGIRRYIWKYFIERLNLLGHREVNVSVFLDVQYGHTHNSFLQIAYCFGTIAGILFAFVVFGGLFFSIKLMLNCSPREISKYMFPLVFFVGYIIMGSFECLVLTGEFLFSFLFVAIGVIMQGISQRNVK